MMVIGFAEPNFTGKIVAELERLRELDFVRIVDALVVSKDDDGDITAVQVSDLSPTRRRRWAPSPVRSSGSATATTTPSKRGRAGAARWRTVTSSPMNRSGTSPTRSRTDPSAAILLLEHLWAIPLRDAIVGAGGIALADEWIHASDLVAVGLAAATE